MTDEMGRNPATDHTRAAIRAFADRLPADDPRDHENTTRGFIAERTPSIVDNTGQMGDLMPVSWDTARWAFVDGDPEPLAEFSADPAGFVAGWERRAAGTHVPTPDSGRLTEEERAAIVGLDYGALYALGAHPYLLLHFARAVECDARGADFATWKEEYRAQVKPHGYPPFFT